jgi:hypothetical protein
MSKIIEFLSRNFVMKNLRAKILAGVFVIVRIRVSRETVPFRGGAGGIDLACILLTLLSLDAMVTLLVYIMHLIRSRLYNYLSINGLSDSVLLAW